MIEEGRMNMKCEEIIALKYLETLTKDSVVYEPNGNRTPDFCIGDKIAIEVRRLNNQLLINDKLVETEKLSFSLGPKMEKFFESYRHNDLKTEYMVKMRFRRPLTVDKNLFQHIKNQIEERIKNNTLTTNSIVLKNLTLCFDESPVKTGNPFMVLMSNDEDLNGFIVSKYINSIAPIIQEKESKIEPYFNEYKSWWLILVDFIGYGMSEIDKEQLNNAHFTSNLFEKVFIINPTNPKHGFEIRIK